MKSYIKTVASSWMLMVSVFVASQMDPAFARGAGSTSNYSATVTFWDRPGDAIRSDGAGAYANGTGGVVAQIQPGYEQQIIVKLSKSKRKYNYSAVLPEATSCNGDLAASATWQGSSSSFFSVKHLGDMAIGSTVVQRAGFNTPSGTFKFFDADLADSIHPHHCSQAVVVTRVSRTTWTVTTDADSSQTYFNLFGLASVPGSRSQLDSNSDPDLLLGNYSMPFGMTVTCPTCP